MNDSELERYIKLYHKTVLGTALCYVRNTGDAEDITQEVFIKLYTYSGSFGNDEHVKAWLIRCTINRCKSLLRSYWYRFSEPLEAAEGKVHYDTGDDEGLSGALNRLDKNTRVVMLLHYREGYKAKEIAALLRTTESSVLHRLSRGRKQLREILTGERNEANDELQGNI